MKTKETRVLLRGLPLDTLLKMRLEIAHKLFNTRVALTLSKGSGEVKPSSRKELARIETEIRRRQLQPVQD
jgi:ribosomal protein L29